MIPHPRTLAYVRAGSTAHVGLDGSGFDAVVLWVLDVSQTALPTHTISAPQADASHMRDMQVGF